MQVVSLFYFSIRKEPPQSIPGRILHHRCFCFKSQVSLLLWLWRPGRHATCVRTRPQWWWHPPTSWGAAELGGRPENAGLAVWSGFWTTCRCHAVGQPWVQVKTIAIFERCVVLGREFNFQKLQGPRGLSTQKSLPIDLSTWQLDRFLEVCPVSWQVKCSEKPISSGRSCFT